MNIFILVWVETDYYNIGGVFSTHEKALKYGEENKLKNKFGKNYYEIEEHTL